MSKGKKIALIVSMVAVLVVAAVLNVTLLTNKKDQASGDTVQTSFFATSRLDRQSTRDYEIAELNAILAMEGDEYEEARKNALEKKQQIIDAMDSEILLETLLKAQGFDEVLVTVNAGMDNVSVIVGTDELTDEDLTRIYNIIYTEVAIEDDYVRIVAV